MGSVCGVMPPQFISLGPLTLNLYTALVGLGALLGLAYVWRQTHDPNILTHLLVIGTCALATGRAGYLALHWPYFAEHTYDILSLTSPGYQEHTAIIGAWLGWKLEGRRQKAKGKNFCLLPFAFCLFLSLIGLAASLGCIPNGCAYGREVFWQHSGAHSLAWLVSVDWPDAFSINNPRLPTQLFMAGWLFVVTFAVWRAGRGEGVKGSKRDATSPPHPLTPSPLHLWPLLFALGDFAIQFARADATPVWAGLRAEQWFDLALTGLAFISMARAFIRSGNSQN